MPSLYFLGNRLLGQGPDAWWADDQPRSPSIAHVCPTCGELWGRVVVQGEGWLPLRSGCIKHPFLDRQGGTFIAPWRHGVPAELPPEVLRYEVEIRFQQLDKEGICP